MANHCQIVDCIRCNNCVSIILGSSLFENTYEELMRKSIKELRFITTTKYIDVSGCLEKSDIVNNIINCLNKEKNSISDMVETIDETIYCVESDIFWTNIPMAMMKAMKKQKKELTEEQKILLDRNLICRCGRVLRRAL